MPMSKSSFYHLLSSKQELYQLAVADLAAEVAADLHPPAPETFAGSAFWPRAGELVEQLTAVLVDRKSTRLNSSHVAISYAVFCLKKQSNQQRCYDGQRRNGIYRHYPL